MLCKQDWSKFSLGWALAARCVRVIHAQCVLQFALLSRTLLRSSSNNEPSDPPYRIVSFLYFRFDSYSMTNNNDLLKGKGLETRQHMNESSRRCLIHMNMSSCFDTYWCDTIISRETIVRSWNMLMIDTKSIKNGNDPYAGSPTNTLLRLLLPLNDPVWASFRYIPNDPRAARKTKPKISLKHSIGSSDGRCVQRTGT